MNQLRIRARLPVVPTRAFLSFVIPSEVSLIAQRSDSRNRGTCFLPELRMLPAKSRSLDSPLKRFARDDNPGERRVPARLKPCPDTKRLRAEQQIPRAKGRRS